ncbi:hypothetical protein [Nissabacter sp. SGAir0207]|uniref:hypothetical protein n=1 Tax=Nissabacter sp. SGAir0207 TaxID=2126321 RepID=UPI0010CD363F|nr:hypothetical protein [Nissabacter sp. SGAir0207]QCR38354.1 hypothetical protein C1N62_19630 [Nissabacter sp. SGAir0207]
MLLPEICRHIGAQPGRYARRFNFASCELWLCTEICHIFNFDLGHAHFPALGDGRYFLYNEDDKRDLSLYRDLSQDEGAFQHQLLTHIEAKVAYPNQNPPKNWLKSLTMKMAKYRGAGVALEGWVFLTWTSDDKYKKTPQPEQFFANVEAQLLGEEALGLLGETWVVEPERYPVIDEVFEWRGRPKRIVVQALRIVAAE